MRLATVISLLATCIPAWLASQTAPTEYVRLAEAHEIALARSAAPAAVSDRATIWVLRDGQYRIAVEGEGENHCFVARSTPLSLEPICYDAEAAASVLPWEIEHFRLRTSGASDEERETELARAVGAGEIPLPGRPAMSYMMSSGQRLYDPASGRSAGNWRPHVMLYVPYLTPDAIGLEESLPTIQVARPGTPMAHLVIVVPEFVKPEMTPTGASAMMKRLTPILPVDDIEPALPFWGRLGFEQTARVPEEGAPVFLMLEKDGIEVMLQTFDGFDEDRDALGEIPRGGTLLYLEVDDLAAIESALEDAEVLIPRRRMFYGAEEVVAREPGGHIVTFAEMDSP